MCKERNKRKMQQWGWDFWSLGTHFPVCGHCDWQTDFGQFPFPKASKNTKRVYFTLQACLGQEHRTIHIVNVRNSCLKSIFIWILGIEIGDCNYSLGLEMEVAGRTLIQGMWET